ncbi:hypothetical protein [Paraburkholderia fungorum]|uniref:hypothetical protein n=1 Tax=Paraburkholderia fungorum TaxID=134537 RepID=UPI0038BCA478
MKQLDVECVFQSADQLTYCRRGHVQLFGGGDIAQMSRYRFKSPERVQVMGCSHTRRKASSVSDRPIFAARALAVN